MISTLPKNIPAMLLINREGSADDFCLCYESKGVNF